jgi:GNAT superfamily N-acetyltransferase
VDRVQLTDLVVVRVVPTRMWHALVDDEVAGKAHVVSRPDRRHFVAVDAWRDDVFDALLEAVVHDLSRELATLVGETDDEELARWTRHGFREWRREDEYEIRPQAGGIPAAPVPPGYRLVGAGDVDLDALRRLDDEVRQDVPGMQGWVNDADTFGEQTLYSPLFRAARSLVAVDEVTGACAGLLYVRAAPRWAKVGLLGVGREHRRRGLGLALLAQALRRLADDGIGIALAEADSTHEPARALLSAVGARRTGGTVELVRKAT